ncbi:methyl-accepting chemotaxis sensory transducer [Limimonas halophila]|uniref:Methyl-accepting chemotaxis sensory transducer n=1 Tax=Limimonas halophila TaxID=1082479 RepID=A0A1G7SZH9_9PROT|nr:methyl-accepting chemotaxis protein [Limimonas halophila]SDG28371.1 methyl-accepting chemotaxis sensory transducer [Limimonas halophila]
MSGDAAPEQGHNLMQRLAEEAGALGVDLADVAGSVADLSERVTAQAGALQQLHQATSEVSEQNTRIAEAARRSRDDAASVSETVATSRQSIDESVEQIHGLVDAVSSMEERLNGLQTALEQVGSAASRIDAIAKQTNLLALNASIEAARAGEAGKGFAVVADEVKELANQTGKATEEISSTLSHLREEADALLRQGRDSTERARSVSQGTQVIRDGVGSIAEAMSGMEDRANHIAEAAETIESSCTELVTTVKDLSEGVEASSATLSEAGERTDRLKDSAERLIGLTASADVETVDTPFIQLAQQKADEIGRAFEDAIARGQIDEATLFDFRYEEIPGTNPVRHEAPFSTFTDRVLPPIQEPALQTDERMVACCAVDKNGYLPTHNKHVSYPQSDDPTWNAKYSRQRTWFQDRVGRAAGANTEPFLLQAYRRKMGDHNLLLKDVSAPIYVNGKHWGGVRIDYRA